jgi:hypothetical protein
MRRQGNVILCEEHCHGIASAALIRRHPPLLDTLFGDDLHAKRMQSLAGATLGVIQSALLAIGLIGRVSRWHAGG